MIQHQAQISLFSVMRSIKNDLVLTSQPIAPANCRPSRPVAFVISSFFQEFPYNGGSFTILFVSITKNLPILAYNPFVFVRPKFLAIHAAFYISLLLHNHYFFITRPLPLIRTAICRSQSFLSPTRVIILSFANIQCAASRSSTAMLF